jgi:hypothetical protein
MAKGFLVATDIVDGALLWSYRCGTQAMDSGIGGLRASGEKFQYG